MCLVALRLWEDNRGQSSVLAVAPSADRLLEDSQSTTAPLPAVHGITRDGEVRQHHLQELLLHTNLTLQETKVRFH